MTLRAAIIGAAGGMGRAVSERLAVQGYALYLLDLVDGDPDRPNGPDGTEPQAAYWRGDASGPAAFVSMTEALGGSPERALDVLVIAAGESLMLSLDETGTDDWNRVIAANLTTVFTATRELLPYLRRSQNPSIVIISSKTAVRGYPVVAYSAAKAGALGFARALSAELAQERIRVVPVCPGPVDTPMRWSSTPDMERDLVIPVDCIADTVSYLVGLPRGVTVDTLVIQSSLYD